MVNDDEPRTWSSRWRWIWRMRGELGWTLRINCFVSRRMLRGERCSSPSWSTSCRLWPRRTSQSFKRTGWSRMKLIECRRCMVTKSGNLKISMATSRSIPKYWVVIGRGCNRRTDSGWTLIAWRATMSKRWKASIESGSTDWRPWRRNARTSPKSRLIWSRRSGTSKIIQWR